MRQQRQMILCVIGLAGLSGTCGCATAQTVWLTPQSPQYVQYPQGPPVAPAGAVAMIKLSADQLDQLLGPVALYPDPLLSLVFPAATYPQDVLAAQQWMASNANPTESALAAQSWDQSVIGLAHYPTVLKMMSDQIEWTQALGAAFVNQQPDVMASVQRLRAMAQADHNLQTTAQEQVVDDGSALRIEPVDPDTMYVPTYDPSEVYINTSPISYSIGYPIGLWDDDDFDWGQQYVVVGGGWYRGWHHPAAWDQHPPAWDRHPAGWAASPKPWARSAQAAAAPRLSSASVAHLNLSQPRGSAAGPGAGMVRPLPPQVPVGRPAAVPLSNNAFDSAQSREDTQRAQQRARPMQAAPEPQRAVPIPQRVAPMPEPQRAAPMPQRIAPMPAPPERSGPGNAFSGGSGGDTRAQSSRGNASVGRR